MKYLKGYSSQFENIENVNIKDIEQVFYNISDDYNVKVARDQRSIAIFTKPIMNFDAEGDANPRFHPKEKIITVFIKNKNIYPRTDDNIIDFNLIKDDLEFAIDYITGEMNLSLCQIYILQIYSRNLLYKDYDTLLNNNSMINDVISIMLFFK